MVTFTSLLCPPTQTTKKKAVAATGNNEKVMQPPEELPYFPEKWPGKVCALCCLGERSQLGQGEMLRIELKASEPRPNAALAFILDSPPLGSADDEKSPRNSLNAHQPASNRRQKGLNKCKNPLPTEYVDELEKIGYPEIVEFTSLTENGYYYIHRTCALWSMGIVRDLTTGILDNVDEVVSQSMSRKCSFCNRYGAHMACKMSCPKYFHLPCVAASGGFQIIQNFTAFCKEHLGQVPLVCTEDINCRICSSLGDVSNLMICSLCGDHYHGGCVGVAQLPGVRSGWQCKSCRRCQICRVPDAKLADGRSLYCEECDKMYHANCLRPVMTSIPKYGWKCRVSDTNYQTYILYTCRVVRIALFLVCVLAYSAVEYVRIVGLAHRAPGRRLDGIVIIPFVIRAINKGTKDTRVRSVKELIEQQLLKKWLNVACAISKSAVFYIFWQKRCTYSRTYVTEQRF